MSWLGFFITYHIMTYIYTFLKTGLRPYLPVSPYPWLGDSLWFSAYTAIFTLHLSFCHRPPLLTNPQRLGASSHLSCHSTLPHRQAVRFTCPLSQVRNNLCLQKVFSFLSRFWHYSILKQILKTQRKKRYQKQVDVKTSFIGKINMVTFKVHEGSPRISPNYNTWL